MSLLSNKNKNKSKIDNKKKISLSGMLFDERHVKIDAKEQLKREITSSGEYKDIQNRISIDRTASKDLLEELGLYVDVTEDVEKSIEETLSNRDLKRKIKEIDKINKKPLYKRVLSKDKYSKKDLLILSKEAEIRKKKKAEDFVVIRKEIENRVPIQTVSSWNKILLAIKELDRRGGWSEKRRLLEERRIKEQRMSIQSEIFKKLKEIIDDRLRAKSTEFAVELKLNNKYRNDLNEVLQMDYFKIFSEIRELKHNPNYHTYKAFPPIVLIFVRDIENNYL